MTAAAWNRVRVMLVSLGLTVCLSLVLGIVFERTGRVRDRGRFSQIGTSYDIGGGRRLNLFCEGAGSPAVIFESGLGSPGYSWFKVQPSVARFTRACWYDRAGYGWSDPAAGKRDSRTIAVELHALLKAAGIAPPYILAGHSFGGFNVRVFNGLYPGEVTGAVLVDASHEDQFKSMPAALVRSNRIQAMKFRVVPFAIDIGLVRLMRVLHGFTVAPASVPADAGATLEYLFLQPKVFKAALGEMTLLDTGSATEARNSGNFGDKPLAVISATRPDALDDERFARIWRGQLMPALARLSTHGELIEVDSQHMVPYETPDVIVSAVESVWSRARASMTRRAD